MCRCFIVPNTKSATYLPCDLLCTRSLYSLYSIVHHVGAMGAGHYVASVKNSEGGWKLFNDASISKVNDKKQLVDPSAYVLFYARKDVVDADLSQFWTLGDGMTDMDPAELEKMLKQRDGGRCVLS